MRGHGEQSYKKFSFCHATKVAFLPVILHRFWPFWNDVNQYAYAYTGEKFWISLQGFSRFQKIAKRGNFDWVACDCGTVQTAQFRAMGIILGASRHLKDVPFVHEFWWRITVLVLWAPLNLNFGDWCCIFRACSSSFDVTCKVVAHPLRTNISVSRQIHCNLYSSEWVYFSCK